MLSCLASFAAAAQESAYSDARDMLGVDIDTGFGHSPRNGRYVVNPSVMDNVEPASSAGEIKEVAGLNDARAMLNAGKDDGIAKTVPLRKALRGVTGAVGIGKNPSKPVISNAPSRNAPSRGGVLGLGLLGR